MLDRTKESGALGEPLYLDVSAALFAAGRTAKVCGGRYGLGSKEFTPAMVKAVFDALDTMEAGQHFTVGIDDDVTHLSLPIDAHFALPNEGVTSCKFFGLGADGTVGANKSAIKMMSAQTDRQVQAYFAYDSKKSGGYTVSHLRIGAAPIRAPYLIGQADFLACHQPTLMNLDVVAQSVKPGGTVLLNLPDGMEIPAKLRRSIAKCHALLYAIDADAIAEQCGLGGRINTVMQTAFFQLNAFLPEEQRQQLLTESVQAAYAKKGERVVAANLNAIAKTADALRRVDVPPEWTELPDTPEDTPQSAVEAFMRPMLRQQGDMLPVSAMDARGFAPLGTSRLEARHCAADSAVAGGSVHPVRAVQPCLPAWVHPHVLPAGGNGVSGGFSHGSGEGQGVFRAEFPRAGVAAGLHRMRKLRAGVPCEGKDAGDAPRGGNGAGAGKLEFRRVAAGNSGGGGGHHPARAGKNAAV